MEEIQVHEVETIQDTLELQPYRFEPIARRVDPISESETDSSVSDNEDNLEDINPERIGNTDWCTCGNCTAMDTGLESRCCREYEIIESRMEEEYVDCITYHEGFAGNCLNKYVVRTALNAYVQEVCPIDDNELPHKTYRYIAYRNFTRFIYDRLRRYERKVIPSCCVTEIRKTFPSERYDGFKYARP